MSTGLELLPLALAISAAVAVSRKRKTSSSRTLTTSAKTRMRDEDLLEQALMLSGHYLGTTDGMCLGVLGGQPVTFSHDTDGTFTAHFDAGLMESEADLLVRNLDAAYCGCVQERTLQQVLSRAEDFGLRVISNDVADDASIVLTLEVEEGVRA